MTMFLQVGPDSCEAHRILSDGRHLAVFKIEPEPVVVVPPAVGMRETATGTYELVTHGARRVSYDGATEYEMVVSDNTEEPLKWRRLGERSPDKAATLARFNSFKEGDDDRRTQPHTDSVSRRPDISHPSRREGDERQGHTVPQV